MKFINSRLHGILDYPLAIFIFASPWIFHYEHRMAKHVAVLVGASLLVLNISTDYEMGILKLISVRLHLTIETILGVFLAVSPMLFEFSDFVYLPHLLLGLFIIVFDFFTKRISLRKHLTAGRT